MPIAENADYKQYKNFGLIHGNYKYYTLQATPSQKVI